MLILTGALLILASSRESVHATVLPSAENSPVGKEVFAHYMLCFAAFGEKGNSSNATAGYQQEISIAQANGIDGFAIEYLGRDSYYLPSAIGMFAACEAHNKALPAGSKPFKLFVIINFCCGLNLTDAVNLYTRFQRSSCAHHLRGRPVFSSWSAINSRRTFQSEAQRWQRDFFSPIQASGLPKPFFLPFIYPANYSGDPAVPHVAGHCAEGTCPESPDLTQQRAILAGFGSALDGLWYWGCAPPADAVVNSSRDTVQACREAGKFVATPVSGPYSPHMKGNNRYTPGHGGRAIVDVWTEHVHSQPDMVIFTTWNDLSEHHYVGPYNLGHLGYHRWNAFPHLAYLELSAYFIQWYKLPAGSPAPSITTEKLFYFYNLQPVNNSCPGDPLGPGRFVRLDARYPIENRLYATLLLNSSAELTLISGHGSPVTFRAAPGVVSFEAPRHPGRQRLRVTRHGTVLADVVGAELVNASSDPSVLARCDHQTFTGSALLAKDPRTQSGVLFGPPRLIEGGPMSNEGSCHPVNMFGLDAADGSRVVAGQLGLPWTGWHGTVYTRPSTSGAGWSHDHITGLFGTTFPSACASPCLNVSTFGTLTHFGPGEIATGFNFSGDNHTGGLFVSTLTSSPGIRAVPTGVRAVFRGIPKPIRSGPYTSGGARLARGGTAGVRLSDGSLLQTAIVTFDNQDQLRSPNATSVLLFHSDDEGVTWDFRATIADAADYPESEEGPNEHDMVFLPDGKTLFVVMRFDGGDGPLTHCHKPFYRTTSRDWGRTWTKASAMPDTGTARPRLLCLGNTVLLSGGRMCGVGGFDGWDARLWTSNDSGRSWSMNSISYHHNLGVNRYLNQSFAYRPGINDSKVWPWGTTSYTSLVRLDDHRALITYDMEVPVYASFSMEIKLV